jgi:hypothetical protein
MSNGDRASTLTSLALKTDQLASFDVAIVTVLDKSFVISVIFFYPVFSLVEDFGEDMLSDYQIFLYGIWRNAFFRCEPYSFFLASLENVSWFTSPAPMILSGANGSNKSLAFCMEGCGIGATTGVGRVGIVGAAKNSSPIDGDNIFPREIPNSSVSHNLELIECPMFAC